MTPIKHFLPSLLLFFLFSCNSEEVKYQEIFEDYCATTQAHNFPKLSNQIDPLLDSFPNKTGIYVMEEGDMSMVFRAWLSESAEKTIDIQYFIFSGDNVGLIAVDYLLRAADRGVKVRLLVDDIMVEADADELLAINSHPNLSIKIYNPTANIGKTLPEKLFNLSTQFRGFNQRMHNKTFVIDNKMVITGGRNIADEYFGYDHQYNFRDRDILMLGKEVKNVTYSFSQFWDSNLSVPIDQLIHENVATINAAVKFEYLRQYACSPENYWPEVREKVNIAPQLFEKVIEKKELRWVNQVNFVSDIPGKNKGESGLKGGGITTDSLVNLIRNTKKSIYIQSPYLVTTQVSQALFKQAIERGVEIKILTNSLTSTDNLEAFSGYARERELLLETGVDIYEFKPDAAIRFQNMQSALQKKLGHTPIFGLHAKSMVLDNQISVIGTFNLDPRSANLNTECIAIIHDSTIATRLRIIMEEELQEENAWHITKNFNPDQKADASKRFSLWLRGIVPKSIL